MPDFGVTSNSRYVIWGADFLGQCVLKTLLGYGSDVLCFWDKNYHEIRAIEGIPVKAPLEEFDNDNYVVILAMGNCLLREKLRSIARSNGCCCVMSEDETRKIHRDSLKQDIVFDTVNNGRSMNLRDRLAAAFDYAADSDYSVWKKQQLLKERARAAENLFLMGLDGYDTFSGEWDNYCINNGLMNIKGICDIRKSVQGGNRRLISGDCKIVSPEEIKVLDNVFVIMTRLDKEVQTDSELQSVTADRKLLDSYGIAHCHISELEWSVYDGHISGKEFRSEKEKALKVFDFLSDDRSKEVYANTICNRIAPQYALIEDRKLNSNGHEYFEKDCIEQKDLEYFVDGGAYIGDTIEELVKNTDGIIKRIYAFEFDEKNYGILKQLITDNGWDFVRLIKKGLYSENKRVSLNGEGLTAHIGKCMTDGDTEIVSLDSELAGEKVTYIKMDIEGAEMSALKGAEEIIKEQKPTLGICTYHHIEDMWRVPLYGINVVPDYHIKFRHYTDYQSDTVCYMTINEVK